MKPKILVHGGAGPRGEAAHEEARAEGCRRAAARGFAVLLQGRSALDAVLAAVVVLEDDPAFNAGTGSCFNEEGLIEMDASVMDGATLSAGAVAAVTQLKNPILLANLVRTRTPHVLLVGVGAERLAAREGLSFVEEASLRTARAQRQFDELRAPETKGTVGAVAIDAHGHVAAATSTGGTRRKMVGRVGDSPLIGAGTFADDLTGAASATGDGEACIRAVVCKRACDLLADLEPSEAARRALQDVTRAGGEAGLILVDRHGRLGFAHTTEHLAHGSAEA